MKRISPQQALELQTQGWTYLDVRSTPEFERGHPAGAAHVPLLEAGALGMQPNASFLEQVLERFGQETPLIVGCEAGGRSMKAAMLLEAAGVKQVVDQRAGWGGARGPDGQVVEAGWQASGLPIESGKGQA